MVRCTLYDGDGYVAEGFKSLLPKNDKKTINACPQEVSNLTFDTKERKQEDYADSLWNMLIRGWLA